MADLLTDSMINFIEIKWVSVLIFSWKTAKSSKQFERKMYSSFQQVAHMWAHFQFRLEITYLLLTDTIKHFRFFLSSLTNSNNYMYMHTVKVKS